MQNQNTTTLYIRVRICRICVAMNVKMPYTCIFNLLELELEGIFNLPNLEQKPGLNRFKTLI